ncbi:hypothetical protein MGG_17066 [Pyricularia oryzae 70-15]|uniref:Uncharacterized protein n=2 Tax=Pyricularia oryzae TaxID=318829 RepID=G4N7D0_PYRO7|nr:uncharacterized protein MGG_17066 [Pyricularia oryzae 70-15]EHA49989.1 hypothetical protein MGG_17066 [Pyricularia oryzae 70-15]KAI7911264.1 hypothetical protein M9X92_010612 [Pyricularia oryzae]KAI7923440.1 hypothetical protein M0657_005172 [Pyricularia oryzae]QBZ60518.1 hypothetical protein PoMZ_07460 [Pyricularia oryzae]
MGADNFLAGVSPCTSAAYPRRDKMQAGFSVSWVFLGLLAVADWARNATCGWFAMY